VREEREKERERMRDACLEREKGQPHASFSLTCAARSTICRHRSEVDPQSDMEVMMICL